MPYSPRCKDCSGEDCVCCEVYLEEQADRRAEEDHDPMDDMDWNDDGWDMDDDCDKE